MSERTAGEAVTESIRALVSEFDETEPAALSGETEGVHRHRTAVRRLRSVLGVYRDLFDAFAVGQLRGLLKEWGSALGVVRDHEVSADLATALLADVPAAGLDPHVAARLVQPGRDGASSAHARLVEIHELERMGRMRGILHSFAANPPLAATATASAATLRDTLITTARAVLRKAKRERTSLSARHSLRKQARRLRHAVEAVTTDPPGLFGDRIRRLGKIAHRIQSDLGDHRDAQLLVTRIERAGVLAGRAGEDAVVYDELAAVAAAYADDALRKVRRQRKKLAAALG